MNLDRRARRAGEGKSVNPRRGRLGNDQILELQGCCDGQSGDPTRQHTPQPHRPLEDKAAPQPAIPG
jgi:hypothetical protein